MRNDVIGEGKNMNRLMENGLLNEVIYGDNFAYTFNDKSMFSTTEYKILQNQMNNLFVKCMKILCNGKIQIYYMTEEYKMLKDVLFSVDEKNFITIVINLLSAVLEVKNNGFLTCQNIDAGINHIYIQPSTYKISLIYLPSGKKIFQNGAEFENELRTGLVDAIQKVPALSTSKIAELSFDLSNRMLSVEDILLNIQNIQFKRERKSGEFKYKEQNPRKIVKLVSINTPVPIEIFITKDEFTIGRKKDAVDGLISFNKMIGRIHCKFVRKGDQYAVIDLKSSNGTYVNKVRLLPEQPCPVKNMDVIRLANSDFQLVIE